LGRAPFFETGCCPGNLSRFLPSLPGYAYAVKGDDLYVNLFVQGEASVDIGERRVTVRQETRYPWDGAVRIAVQPDRPGPFAVITGQALTRPFLAIPCYAWAHRGPGEMAVWLPRR
jgi:DUF1680 family protein